MFGKHKIRRGVIDGPLYTAMDPTLTLTKLEGGYLLTAESSDENGHHSERMVFVTINEALTFMGGFMEGEKAFLEGEE